MGVTTIAFRCTQCNKSLRAGIEAAGKPAKCSACGAVVTIPTVQDSAWPPGLGPKPVPAAPASQPSVPVATPVHPSTAKPASSSSPPQVQLVAPTAAAPRSVSPPAANPAREQAPPREPKPPSHGSDAILPAPDFPDQPLEIEAYELDLPPPLPPAAGSFAPPPTRAVPPSTAQPKKRRRGGPNVVVDEVVARAWQIYKSNLGSMIGALLVAGFMTGIVGGVGTVAMRALGILDLTDAAATDGWKHTVASHALRGAALFFVLGLFTFFVNLARGRDAAAGNVFSAGGIFISGLLVWAILLVPLLALQFVTSGLGLAEWQKIGADALGELVIQYFLWIPFALALADRQSNPIDALEHAAKYVGRHFLTVLGLFVVSLCVFVTSALACGIGLLFGIPFILLLLAVGYTSNMPEA